MNARNRAIALAGDGRHEVWQPLHIVDAVDGILEDHRAEVLLEVVALIRAMGNDQRDGCQRQATMYAIADRVEREIQ